MTTSTQRPLVLDAHCWTIQYARSTTVKNHCMKPPAYRGPFFLVSCVWSLYSGSLYIHTYHMYIVYSMHTTIHVHMYICIRIVTLQYTYCIPSTCVPVGCCGDVKVVWTGTSMLSHSSPPCAWEMVIYRPLSDTNPQTSGYDHVFTQYRMYRTYVQYNCESC